MAGNLLRVFVYGTLKPGERNYQRYCADRVMGIEPAIAQGKLYALPFGYPALTWGQEPIRGVVLSFADSQVLKGMDELEGYFPHHLDQQQYYLRCSIPVASPAGTTLGTVWTYLMNLEKIQQLGGIWLPQGEWSGDTHPF